VHEPGSENIDRSCSFAVTGFSREVRRCVCGADAMQALVLAIHILPTEVRVFVENEPGAFIDEPGLGIDRACRMNLDPDTAVNEFVAYYVRQLSGPGREDAWHRLAEAGRGVDQARRARYSTPRDTTMGEVMRVRAVHRVRQTSAVHRST